MTCSHDNLREYNNIIYKYVIRGRLHRNDHQDVVQDAALIACEHNYSTYKACAVAVRRHIQRMQRRRMITHYGDVADPRHDRIQGIVPNGLRNAIPVRYREFFDHIGKMPVLEAARACNFSRYRARRAIHEIRRAWNALIHRANEADHNM
jgi:hypothetical protein